METYLKITNIQLWARVGVLKEERESGQLFKLDVFLWADFENCTQGDDIKKTIDYSKLVEVLTYQSKKICYFTIEKYSDEIVKVINEEFQLNRIKIILTKCKPPIIGFNGEVSIVRVFQKN